MCPLRNTIKISVVENMQTFQHILKLKMKVKKDLNINHIHAFSSFKFKFCTLFTTSSHTVSTMLKLQMMTKLCRIDTYTRS